MVAVSGMPLVVAGQRARRKQLPHSRVRAAEPPPIPVPARPSRMEVGGGGVAATWYLQGSNSLPCPGSPSELAQMKRVMNVRYGGFPPPQLDAGDSNVIVTP